MSRLHRSVLAALVVVIFVAAVGCGDDDAGVDEDETVDEAARTDDGATSETAESAAGPDSEFCVAMEAMTVSVGEAAATILGIGFGSAMFELLQGGDRIDPADAEEVGVSLIAAMQEARVPYEEAGDDAEVAAAAAPQSVAEEVQLLAEGTKEGLASLDRSIASYEAVTDWVEFFGSVESPEELFPDMEAPDSSTELTPEMAATVERVVEKECGIDLTDISLGEDGRDTSPGESDPGTAEQVEDLFNDQASRQEVASALAARLGLTAAESECFLEGVDFDDLAALESGGSEAARSRVIAALTACGIDPAGLGG